MSVSKEYKDRTAVVRLLNSAAKLQMTEGRETSWRREKSALEEVQFFLCNFSEKVSWIDTTLIAQFYTDFKQVT